MYGEQHYRLSLSALWVTKIFNSLYFSQAKYTQSFPKKSTPKSHFAMISNSKPRLLGNDAGDSTSNLRVISLALDTHK